MRPIDDGRCFACGAENEIGLHLKFEPEEDGVRARTTIGEKFQGWRGITHGGIAVALLDEAMAYAAGYGGYRGVTGSMNVRFRKPIPLAAPVEIHGRIKWMRRNVLEIEAWVADAGGNTLVEGEGRFVAQGRVEDVDDRLLKR
ncbi:MAG TPA: PaaI family thioesterase [Candidatus Rubrimentiphilum sp.]|nr:PaaI family thioesterase [Candidatus Rubrimentiphilum sp.]